LKDAVYDEQKCNEGISKSKRLATVYEIGE